MRFTPKSEEELALDNLLPEGKYPFTVKSAEDTVSKKGNAMIKLGLTVYGSGAREVTVFDYLLDNFPDKLFKFCKSVGLEEKYNAGELEPYDCEHREGWAHIKIDPAKDGYGPKNTVSYYIAPGEAEGSGMSTGKPTAESKRKNPFPDDGDEEIPF